jgi:hypothetical protein
MRRTAEDRTRRSAVEPGPGLCDAGAVKGFARYEFQLMLLRRMADFQPELVRSAYGEMGATKAQYLAAHVRWQRMLRSPRAPRGFDLVRAVLGPSDGERSGSAGDLALVVHTWRLAALWPDLRWECVVTTDHALLGAGLARAADADPPNLPPLGRLAPWSCVLADVLARYPRARRLDSDTADRWPMEITTAHGRSYRLVFVHGLFQTVTRVGGRA